MWQGETISVRSHKEVVRPSFPCHSFASSWLSRQNAFISFLTVGKLSSPTNESHLPPLRATNPRVQCYQPLRTKTCIVRPGAIEIDQHEIARAFIVRPLFISDNSLDFVFIFIIGLWNPLALALAPPPAKRLTAVILQQTRKFSPFLS